MPRPSKSDPDQALIDATILFWKEGFHTVGTRQIETETGVTRFTLQTKYGGKKPYFLKTLDYYLDNFESILAPRMVDGKLDTLAQWFEHPSIPPQFAKTYGHGCLMVNSIIEFADADTDVNERANRFLSLLKGGFLAALQAIDAAGNVGDNFDPESKTELLLGCAIGMNVEMKIGSPLSNPMALAQATAGMIRGWAA